jgi:hypothetical protein
MQLQLRAALGRHLVYPLMLAAAGLLAAPSAYAGRPFDGTDAAVPEQGMLELEVGAGYLRQTGGRMATLPTAAFNFGLAGDIELALEGSLQTEIDRTGAPYRTGLNDTQIAVKHVFRKGSLQEGGSGVSVAGKCAALLPGYHGEHGSGFNCAAAASQRFDWGTVHLNLGRERDRDHRWVQLHGVIVEGPEDWKVRPALELTHEHTGGEPSSRGMLVGLVWNAGEELAFDAAVRRVRSDGAQLTEARFGLTWGFKTGH